MTSSIHRGFHRIGVVLAALALLLVLFLIVQGEVSSVDTKALVAAFLYAAARAVDWVLTGFLGSLNRPSS